MKKLRKRLMSWLMVFAITISTFIPMTVSAAGTEYINKLEFNLSFNETLTDAMTGTEAKYNVNLTTTATNYRTGGTLNSYMYQCPSSAKCNVSDATIVNATNLVAGRYTYFNTTIGSFPYEMNVVNPDYDFDKNNLGNVEVWINGTKNNDVIVDEYNPSWRSVNVYIPVTVSQSAATLHTVTFDLDGGTIEGNNTYSANVENGGKVTKPADPTKSEYRFDNWYKNSSKTTLFDFTNTTITSPTTIYAKYIKIYRLYVYMQTGQEGWGTVYLDGNPGTQGFFADEGSTHTATAVAASGYKFKEWQKGGVAVSTNANYTINNLSETTELYGVFEVDTSSHTKHKVTFINGINNSTINIVEVNDGGNAIRPATDPTMDNYTFVNWYSDASMTIPFDFTKPISKDTPIYAKFNPNTVSITLDSNGGTGSATIPINYGGSWLVENPSAHGITAPNGKVFEGWKIGNTIYKVGQTYSNVITPITAIAQWQTQFAAKMDDVNLGNAANSSYTPSSYKTNISVTNTGADSLYRMSRFMKVELTSGDITAFNIDRGSFTEGYFNNNFTVDVAAIEPVSNLAPKTYTATVTLSYSKDGNSTNYEVLDTAAVTFTVDAPTQHTVTFVNGIDNSTINAATVNDGEKVARPSDPTAPTGYTFDDWYTDGTYTTKFNFTNTTITTATSIYAKFIPETYLAELYDLNLGTADEGYNHNDYAQNIRMKNTGAATLNGSTSYKKVELTSGNITDFSVVNSTWGTTISPNATEYAATVYPKANLTAGTYTATATLYYDRDGDGTSYTWEVMDTATVTFKVNAPTQYTVTFINGNDSSTINTATVNENEKVTRPTTDPTMTNYTFDNWYADVGMTIPFDFDTQITAHTPIYAKFIPNSVTPTYVIESGANQTYTIDSNVDVVIKASGAKANLSKIQIDGTDLDTANYNTEEGSTILTLKYAYLNTLSGGDHTVKFVYNDGDVSTNLKVVKNTTGGNTGGNTDPSTPTDPSGTNTGGNTGTNTNNNTSSPQTSDNIVFYIMTMLLSLFGIAGASVYVNRKKLFNR